MKQKAAGLLVAIAMLVSFAVLPVAANTVDAHVGGFSGWAEVGKVGACGTDGRGSARGGGLGFLPELPNGTTPIEGKNGWFSIFDATVLDVSQVGLQSGAAYFCGRLTAPLEGTVDGVSTKSLGLGATCLATRGWDGYGVVGLNEEDLSIHDLGWEVTVGGTFVMTGDAISNRHKADPGRFVAIAQSMGEYAIWNCQGKTQRTLGGNAKEESQPYTEVGVYSVLPGGGNPVPD